MPEPVESPRLSLAEAFRSKGIPVLHEGRQALLLPLDNQVIAEVDTSPIGRTVSAGQMLLAWNDGAQRRGAVLNGDARNDLVFVIERQDGGRETIGHGSGTIFALTEEILRAKQASEAEIAKVARENAEAERRQAEARERGEAVVPYEPRQAAFAPDAFDRAAGIVGFTLELGRQITEDPLSDPVIRAEVNSAVARIMDRALDALTPDQKARVEKAWRMRAEISLIAPDHPDALPAVLPPPYEGDGEAARTVASQMPVDRRGLEAVQASVLARNASRELTDRVFSVATTTPAMRIVARPLSHEGMRTIDQELAGHENDEAGREIIARMSQVLAASMPGYRWEGKLYSRGGADILLMRDSQAAYVYVWDSASRVRDVDVDQAVLRRPTAADVPSDEEMERLRRTLEQLRHDNGALIEFGPVRRLPEPTPLGDQDDGTGW